MIECFFRASRSCAIRPLWVLYWPAWGGWNKSRQKAFMVWVSKMAGTAFYRERKFRFISQLKSSWCQEETQRVLCLFLLPSPTMCFRNYLERGPAISLKILEAAVPSNLTFSVGEVSLTKDMWEASWDLWARVTRWCEIIPFPSKHISCTYIYSALQHTPTNPYFPSFP